MKRRSFLKAGIGLGTALGTSGLTYGLVAHSRTFNDRSSYQRGDLISREVFVHDREMKKRRLADLCSKSPTANINLLYVYGGGANHHEDRLGDIWCPDSFEDLHTLRFVDQKYSLSQVRLLPVACAPVYSSRHYGFEPRVFLDEPDDSEEFLKSAQAFITSTEEVVKNDLIPVQTYYDLRHRLLFNRREDLTPGDDYGEIFDWQGKFRSQADTQKYGTPTVWLLDPEGKILEGPFWGNFYHSEPFTIGYTVVDLDRAIRKHLPDSSKE